MKSRTGYVYQEKGSWYARLTYTDNGGHRKNIKRRVESKTHGYQILKQLIQTLEEKGQHAIEADRFTFNDLCDYYTKHYMIPAQYVEGRKIAGLRSIAGVTGYVKVFREYFGRQKIKTITYDDLSLFRSKRLKTSTHQSKQRSLTTVNREMAYLRRLLNIAERNGWINKNPFKSGDALINVADEKKRETIIDREQEEKLLAACHGKRAHLRPIIIAALDTGCRMRELLKLVWRDVDLTNGFITIQAFNTKTMRERQVSITTRLSIELNHIWEASTKNPSESVFGLIDVRHAFKAACKEAGIDKLRFHDLRHSHATRLDDLGFSLAKIGGQLGHTQLQTTLRYVNRDKSSIKQVANALDVFNAPENKPTEALELVN
jgi:integrase